MLALALGISGFALYLLYDVNSYAWQSRVLRLGFFAGSMLIGAATILQLYSAWKQGGFSDMTDWVLIFLSAAAFGALIYCLFFALPFQDTYVAPANGRKVYEGGPYAMCRHPGVICFFFMYLLIGLAALPAPFLIHGIVFSLLNVAYAWFQDRVTFPKNFVDYEGYRTRVPFLIPTKDSIRLARKTWGRSNGEEAKQ